MIMFRLLILPFIVLFFVLPLYASDINSDLNQDTTDKQQIISSPPEEEMKDAPKILTDYNSNELAEKAVKRNITLFTEKIREKFSLWLSRSGKYLELMQGILKEKEIPEEIVFLPLIESGFNPYAYSPARAVGYWQFIASTAKRYGLEINWWRDERRDPVKSTVAAADYLNDLHDMFGSWNLAMAAYNAGEGKILKALSRSKTDDYWALLNTCYIRSETKDYVPKFIAASLIANSPQNFGFEDLEYHPPLNYDELTIETPVDLDVIAECTETSVETIKELNPELRRWCTPPDVPEYTLRVPAGTKDIFLENLSQISENKRFSIDTYKVKKGDTFKKISRKTGFPMQVILDLNSMEKIMPLKEGAKIYIPPKGKFVLDTDDRITIKKAAFKSKKRSRFKARKLGTRKTVKRASFKQRKKTRKTKQRMI
jgi:membrane-bound lytic murein transglycosylase D